MRRALLIAVATLAGCASEPTDVTVTDQKPAFVVQGSTGGGISFAAGSGCTVVLQHLECSLTANGLGSYLVGVSQRGQWSYTYQCVHRKTGKPSRQGPRPGSVTFTDLRSVTGTDPLTITGTVLAPLAPTDCAGNKGAFTATAVLDALTPVSWSLYVYKNEDPNNVFAEIHELL